MQCWFALQWCSAIKGAITYQVSRQSSKKREFTVPHMVGFTKVHPNISGTAITESATNLLEAMYKYYFTNVHTAQLIILDLIASYR